MSLPNYLAKIKSSGVYRFVWDKSIIPPQTAETLRLVVGYSEKGPFNTPVYVETVSDFITIYGNISKRLERKGIYFHRLALQALSAGPILALNVKPFTNEKVDVITFNACDIEDKQLSTTQQYLTVSNVYDTNRFWTLNADLLPSKIEEFANGNGSISKYISVVSTDTKENSCSIFMRPSKPESYKGITVRQWYNSQSLEMPEYLFDIQDTNLDNYFMDVYVFRGQFTDELCKNGGVLATYFDQDAEGLVINTTSYVDAFGDKADALDDMASDVNSNFIATYTGCTIPYFKDANGSYISLDIKFNQDNSKHKMLMKLDEARLEDVTSEELVSLLSGLYVNNDVFGSDFEAFPIYLKGYDYTTIEKTTSMANMQNLIFGQLRDKGMRTALTNRVDIEYHYLVDTFDSLVSKGCKSELAALAKEKDNTFAILNFPKMSNFVSDADFKSEFNGTFDIKKIANKFSLPSELNGASYAGFYTQLTFSDGTLKNVIPSAALVSNNFMEKWSSRQPYYIVAGPIYGRLNYEGMVGPDYNFGRSDLDVLEPMGVNAIIYVPRKGTYINSNQTAKQIPVSALSKVHIRELVIYLQNEIESLLQSYQWELNTQPLRDTIKAKADSILDTIMNNGGVYAYRNVCDSSNNTPEIIDNEMIVLDTEIEPARGAGKMVHQLTIHKTGGMTSKIS